MRMNLNGHPYSFLDTHLNCVSKPCDRKSCYEDTIVFLLNMVPRCGIDDTIQLVTFVYIFASIFNFCSFHKVLITKYYNNPLLIVHFYNMKSITVH